MQYIGNGQYQIKNKTTGETKTVNESDLSKYGLTPDTQQPGEAAIAKTGLFNISILGGILRNAENSTESYGRMAGGAGFEGVRGVASALGDQNAYVNQDTGQEVQNPFLNKKDLETFSNAQTAIPEVTGRALNFGANVYSAAKLPGLIRSIPGAIKSAPSFFKNPLNTIRSNMLNSAPVDTTEFETKTLQQLYDSPFYKNAPAATQEEARIGLEKLLGNINPSTTGGDIAGGEITKPAQTLLNKVYENLGAFEKMSKAYARGGDLPSTATAQGANLASHAVRQITKDMSPWKAKLVTDVMHKSMTVAGNWKPILKALGITAAGAEGFNIVHNLNK